ncbi:DUF1266 domain-containing protein [Actinocorallia sp. API 0066]|uniref:DUF1266 domain-containing protein n=1 Tax=Actinocorallia sp. API 0066 TaxID=2896846 RepID=UPI001E421EB7|nr:DUF1266 domain-containing protein [Actinocorallia sp. API 0066]MCD0449576.1 DUF1266 domain-containing protein [Actinocorallia sp. API 0066]
MSLLGAERGEMRVERLDDLRRWWLALSAIQVEWGGGSHDALRMDEGSADAYRRALHDNWGVDSTASLLDMARWLTTSGHAREYRRHLGRAPLAWDAARLVFLVRAAYSAGLLADEEAAWELCERMTVPVLCHYSSWQGYAEDFLAARRVWVGDGLHDPQHANRQEEFARAAERLLDPANGASPWRRLAFAAPAPYLVVRRPPVGGRAEAAEGGATENRNAALRRGFGVPLH